MIWSTFAVSYSPTEFVSSESSTLKTPDSTRSDFSKKITDAVSSWPPSSRSFAFRWLTSQRTWSPDSESPFWTKPATRSWPNWQPSSAALRPTCGTTTESSNASGTVSPLKTSLFRNSTNNQLFYSDDKLCSQCYEAGATFDNCFGFLRQCKDRSFLGTFTVHKKFEVRINRTKTGEDLTSINSNFDFLRLG